MHQRTRWGILAPGKVAHSFANGLHAVEGAVLQAVGSRSAERAAEFAKEHGARRSYGSYAELVADPEVDVIYVANPHPFHKDSSILCLENGKAVLCEKPFTVNAREAEQVISVARDSGVFLMEAMWSRFLPAMRQARAWIDGGRIGDLRIIDACLSFRAENPEERLLSPDLAGGGLLDVGIYVVSLAFWLTGKSPIEISSHAHIGETGVDELAGVSFKYDDGAIAQLIYGVTTDAPHRAAVYGTDGWIEFTTPFWYGTTVTLHSEGEEIEFSQPHLSNGYEYQVIEVAKCINEGRSESSILPLDETLRIMETLDTIRAQWGLVYPFER